jgi:hypothetical protein
MANILTFKSGDQKKGPVAPEQMLLSAIKELLHSNQRVACAVGELPARFIEVDASVAGVNLDTNCRHYVDAVVEQDRGRLLAAMSEVLEATLEYAKAIEGRFRGGPEISRRTSGATSKAVTSEIRECLGDVMSEVGASRQLMRSDDTAETGGRTTARPAPES